MRVRRNCSFTPQFQQEAKVEMYVLFRERGFSHQNIRQAKTRARARDQRELIGCNSKPSVDAPPPNAPVRMITKFGSQWEQVREILVYQTWYCTHVESAGFVGKLIKTDTFTNAESTKRFKIKQFINCSTTRVIYMLTCPCGKAYIGKTKRPLKIWIGEHINSINKKEDESPLAAHFKHFHNGYPSGL